MGDMIMKKMLVLIISVLLMLGMVAVASAGTVGVWGDRFNLNVINNFYSSLPGVTSSVISGQLTSDSLNGVDLLWAVQPADGYTAAEISAMAGFLANGGRIAFMGEHGSYAPNENNRINDALNALGSHMQIMNLAPDAGFHNATVTNGQILSHSLTAGVSTYNYACFAPLTIGTGANKLMLGTDLVDVMMGYENIGVGSIFLITDQNVWDNVNALTNDNKVMFKNLLDAETVPTPEPATFILVGAGLAGLAFARKRLNK